MKRVLKISKLERHLSTHFFSPPTYTGGEIDCVDSNGNAPLHVAARHGQELLVSTLLTNGADKGR